MVVAVCAAGLSALRNSPSGRAMLAVRSAPAAAMASGVSVLRTKLLLFTLSAGLAGFGGVLVASYNTRITATDFTAMTGLVWLAVVVAAGSGGRSTRWSRGWSSRWPRGCCPTT